MQRFLIRSVLVLAVLSATVASLAARDDWPQFRGRDAGVAADDPRLPERWSTTENVLWKADIPGVGWSSPVVSAITSSSRR